MTDETSEKATDGATKFVHPQAAGRPTLRPTSGVLEAIGIYPSKVFATSIAGDSFMYEKLETEVIEYIAAWKDDDIWLQLDLHQNGSVSFEDFHAALIRWKLSDLSGPALRVAFDLFKGLDTDGDDLLTHSEFFDIRKWRPNRPRALVPEAWLDVECSFSHTECVHLLSFMRFCASRFPSTHAALDAMITDKVDHAQYLSFTSFARAVCDIGYADMDSARRLFELLRRCGKDADSIDVDAVCSKLSELFPEKSEADIASLFGYPTPIPEGRKKVPKNTHHLRFLDPDRRTGAAKYGGPSIRENARYFVDRKEGRRVGMTGTHGSEPKVCPSNYHSNSTFLAGVSHYSKSLRQTKDPLWQEYLNEAKNVVRLDQLTGAEETVLQISFHLEADVAEGLVEQAEVIENVALALKVLREHESTFKASAENIVDSLYASQFRKPPRSVARNARFRIFRQPAGSREYVDLPVEAQVQHWLTNLRTTRMPNDRPTTPPKHILRRGEKKGNNSKLWPRDFWSPPKLKK